VRDGIVVLSQHQLITVVRRWQAGGRYGTMQNVDAAGVGCSVVPIVSWRRWDQERIADECTRGTPSGPVAVSQRGGIVTALYVGR